MERISLTAAEAAAMTRSGARVNAAAQALNDAQVEGSGLIAQALKKRDIDPATVDPDSIWDVVTEGDDVYLVQREQGAPVGFEEPDDDPEPPPPKIIGSDH